MDSMRTSRFDENSQLDTVEIVYLQITIRPVFCNQSNGTGSAVGCVTVTISQLVVVTSWPSLTVYIVVNPHLGNETPFHDSKMSTQPYSGTNPIPKISDFFRETAELEGGGGGPSEKTDNVGERKHVLGGRGGRGGNRRTVTDPTTGNEVTIEDANQEFVKEARENNVVVPNANLPDRKDSEVRFLPVFDG